MKQTQIYMLAFEPFRLWSAVAWKTGELMLASIQVIGHRSGLMRPAEKPGNPDNVREFALMGREKAAASLESSQAIAFDSMMLGQKLGAMAFEQMMAGMTNLISLAASRTAGESIARQARVARKAIHDSASAASLLSRSGARIAQKGLKPIHSRATANARRLKKKRSA